MNKIESPENSNRLQIRKLIPAPPERVFRAWTNPDELKLWWGPQGVRCISAEIELKVGGQYRIGNELADGTILFIKGEFDVIERPHLLRYSWAIENDHPTIERVTVQFEAHEFGTELLLTHELISTTALRDQHQNGWHGCMDGLRDYLTGSATG
ncbi:MAG: SRPBCC family protein [Woeseiaceae bacterium]